jgi:hypothetical protein
MKHREFTTRTELKSLTRSIKCAEMGRGSIRLLSECLGNSSMRLGVPFIAPRQLGAIGDNLGRLILPSVGWRSGQSGAPPDSNCRWSGADLLPFLSQTTVASVGAPDSPVPPSDRWCGPRVARRFRCRPLRSRPLAHRTVQ